jgi:hypothetical protein
VLFLDSRFNLRVRDRLTFGYGVACAGDRFDQLEFVKPLQVFLEL